MLQRRWRDSSNKYDALRSSTRLNSELMSSSKCSRRFCLSVARCKNPAQARNFVFPCSHAHTHLRRGSQVFSVAQLVQLSSLQPPARPLSQVSPGYRVGGLFRRAQCAFWGLESALCFAPPPPPRCASWCNQDARLGTDSTNPRCGSHTKRTLFKSVLFGAPFPQVCVLCAFFPLLCALV